MKETGSYMINGSNRSAVMFGRQYQIHADLCYLQKCKPCGAHFINSMLKSEKIKYGDRGSNLLWKEFPQ